MLKASAYNTKIAPVHFGIEVLISLKLKGCYIENIT